MAFGYTRTLPTITGSHSDFSVLLTAGSFPATAIDGGANSIDNGGGNLRAYTDDTKTTQLSLDVVAFVTGGSPDVQVWVKIPTAATGSTIYLEADSVAISQPAFTASFGRNSVWSDYRVVYHFADNGVDSSGSGDDIDVTGASFVDADNGTRAIDTTSAAYSVVVASESPAAGFALQSRFEENNTAGSTSDAFAFSRNTTQTQYMSIGRTSANDALQGVNSSGSGNSSNTGLVMTANQWYAAYFNIHSTTDRKAYADGGNEGVSTVSDGVPTSLALIQVGARGSNSAGRFLGSVGESRIRGTATDANWVLAEHNNQNDPVNWGTSSAWADSGGGAISITGTAVPTQTELDVVTGGKTIILTLAGDTWVTAGAAFDAQRQAIIDGLDSAQSELTGWNNEVRDKEVVTAVARTSSTVVTITLTASASYDITATETITATIPNAALTTGTSDIVGTPAFTVTAVVSGVSIPVIMNQLRNQGIQ